LDSQGLDSLDWGSMGPDFRKPEFTEPDGRGRPWPGQLRRYRFRQRLGGFRRPQVRFRQDLVRFRLALVQFGLDLLPCRLEPSPVGLVRFQPVR